VSRIPFDDGFQMLLAAGLTLAEAIEVLNDELESDRGALGIWRDGIKLSPSHFRRHMRVGLDDDPKKADCAKVFPAGPVGWVKIHVFELDAEQIEALIATLSTPTPEPGRPPLVDKKQEVLAERDRLRTAEEPVNGTSLHAWAVEKWGPDAPSERSIYRWLAEPD
jgi:hypothetical protein